MQTEQSPDSEEKPSPLEEQIVERVRGWFRRGAAHMAEEHYDIAQLQITLIDPEDDEDAGALFLKAKFTETMMLDEAEGPVPGLRLL